MALNIGYLKSGRTHESDEVYTPPEAVMPILRHMPSYIRTIWCPFDEEDSAYVEIFREAGFNVIATHINNGKNFFDYEPEEQYDCIISNPPFSIKDSILKRLYELKKPYAILMPLPTLQGQKRFEYIKDCQALILDKRINFYKNKETKEIQKGVSFASIYLCKDFLEKDLIFEKLNPYS